MLLFMTGFTGLAIKFGVRMIAFGAVLFLVSKRNDNVVIHRKLAVPLVALVFAVLNTALYFILKPVLNLATLGSMSLLMPLVINLILLAATMRIVQKLKWVEIKGVIAWVYLGIALTVMHGVLWVSLDYLPSELG